MTPKETDTVNEGVKEVVENLVKDEDDKDELQTSAGEIKDNLISIKNDLLKKERDKKLKDQRKSNVDQVLKAKRNKMLNKIVGFVTFPFRVNSYVNIIQNIEPLLFVLFVDALMLFFISALGYILYTVYTECDTYQKLLGCTIVAILCIFAQMYVNPVNTPKSNVEGDTETTEQES